MLDALGEVGGYIILYAVTDYCYCLLLLLMEGRGKGGGKKGYGSQDMRETAKNEILAQQEAQEKAERLALAKAKPKEAPSHQ